MTEQERLVKEVREFLGKIPEGAGSVNTTLVATEMAKHYSTEFEVIRAIVIIESHAAGLSSF
jgi:hypothetical protein